MTLLDFFLFLPLYFYFDGLLPGLINKFMLQILLLYLSLLINILIILINPLILAILLPIGRHEQATLNPLMILLQLHIPHLVHLMFNIFLLELNIQSIHHVLPELLLLLLMIQL